MIKRVKVKLSILMVLAFLLTIFLPLAAGAAAFTTPAKPAIKVIVDGKTLSLKAPVILYQNNLLISVGDIFPALGASVTWDMAKQKITAANGSNTIEMVVGSTAAKVNGNPVKLPVAPRMSSGKVMVPLAFVCRSFGATMAWDATTRTVKITTKKNALTELSPAAKLQLQQIGTISSSVHDNYLQLVKVQKLAPAEALQQQLAFLQQQPEVKLAKAEVGGNIFVRYQDGYEMLMLLGEDSRGTAAISSSALTANNLQLNQSVVAPTQITPVSPTEIAPVTKVPVLKDPVRLNIDWSKLLVMMKHYPTSSKALVFDTLYGDPAEQPGLDATVKQKLQNLGYDVTTKYNTEANLATVANIDDEGYGVVFISSHGGVYGADNIFLVGPWYSSPPPMNSGYTGTIVCSAHNGKTGKTEFMYAVGKMFAEKYWTKLLPGTLFVMDTCDGMYAAGIPGFPTTVINKGGSAYLGFTESVSFFVGDNGSKFFFTKLADNWATIESARAAAKSAGFYPPELTINPSGGGDFNLPIWIPDGNESSIPDGKDFKRLQYTRSGTQFIANVTFWGTPAFSEFQINVDTDQDGTAEIQFKCQPKEFTAYDLTGSTPAAICTGSAYISGSTYCLAVDSSNVSTGSGRLGVRLYESSGGDKLPEMIY